MATTLKDYIRDAAFEAVKLVLEARGQETELTGEETNLVEDAVEDEAHLIKEREL